MITHNVDQYILDPKSKQDKVKVTNLKNSPKLHFLLNFELNSTCDTLQKMLDKIHKYEINPASFLEDTERTRFCTQMDRRADGWTDKVKPAYFASTSLSEG